MKKFFADKRNWFYAAFAVIQCVIYVTFMVIDNTSGNSTVVIRYGGILLCLVAACVSWLFYGSDGLCLTVALFFTAVADLFMFVLNDYYEISVCAFIVVQSAYLARIYLILGKKPYSLTVRGVLIAAVFIILGATNTLNFLTALVAVYFPMLLCNTAESLFLVRISKKYLLFFFGLLLFVGCDICVGLYNFDMLGIELSLGLRNFVGAGMWAFYFPSQTLIVLSARRAEFRLFSKEHNNEE